MSQISSFIKIRAVGTELFHADRPTDEHDEANSRFRYFANAPEKPYFHICLNSL
jgi:hypothetical protein